MEELGDKPARKEMSKMRAEDTVRSYKDDFPALEFVQLKELTTYKQYGKMRAVYEDLQELPISKPTFGPTPSLE